MEWQHHYIKYDKTDKVGTSGAHPNSRFTAMASNCPCISDEFSDNMRVLMWILARCAGEVDAVEPPIGFVPKAEDINIEGLDGVTVETIRDLLSVDKDSWLEDVENIKAFYKQVGDHVPTELYDELAILEANLKK